MLLKLGLCCVLLVTAVLAAVDLVWLVPSSQAVETRYEALATVSFCMMTLIVW